TFAPRSSGCSQNSTSPCAALTLLTAAPCPSWQDVQPNFSGGCALSASSTSRRGCVRNGRRVLEARAIDRHVAGLAAVRTRDRLIEIVAVELVQRDLLDIGNLVNRDRVNI